MTTNYLRGYTAENKIVKILKSQKYFAQRSAGSKSSIDIFAFNKNHFKLIQVKSINSKSEQKKVSYDYISNKYMQEMSNFFELTVPSNTLLEFWVYCKGKLYVFRP